MNNNITDRLFYQLKCSLKQIPTINSILLLYAVIKRMSISNAIKFSPKLKKSFVISNCIFLKSIKIKNT